MRERISIFTRQPPWKSRVKRAALWLYENDLITRRMCQRLIDAAGARLV